MRAIATKQPTNDSAKQKKNGDKGRSRSVSPLSTGMPLLQRKCACGGGCPRCQDKQGIQTKLKISEPGDKYEQEADRVADEVMRMPEPSVQRQVDLEEEEEEMLQRKAIESQIAPLVQRQVLPEMEDEEEDLVQRKEINNQAPIQYSSIIHELLNSPGQPLDSETRTFMESRFGEDFSPVRAHTNNKAIQLSQMLNAQAFTYRQDIYFGAGKFPGKNALTAHELTHVLQQTGGHHNQTQSQKSSDFVQEPTIQRVIEVRPPGRGEASAFDRRQELIDRLNTFSADIQYRLDGRRIAYDVIDVAAALTHFDRQMQGFIDRNEVVPMRPIARAGLVGGGSLLIDSFESAYVDLDDMLASNDLSFQMNLLHILVERFSTRDYERRIGSPGLSAIDPATGDLRREFRRAHAAGIDAEVEQLRSAIGDPTITFRRERSRGGTTIFEFRSREGYRVIHVFGRDRGGLQSGRVFVRTRDNREITIEELRVERAAAVVPVPAVP
jgi:hypothetical protein